MDLYKTRLTPAPASSPDQEYEYICSVLKREMTSPDQEYEYICSVLEREMGTGRLKIICSSHLAYSEQWEEVSTRCASKMR